MYYIPNRGLIIELNSRYKELSIYRAKKGRPSSEEIKEIEEGVLSLIYNLLEAKITDGSDIYMFNGYYDIGDYLFLQLEEDFIGITRVNDPKLLRDFNGDLWDEVLLLDCLKMFLLNERYEPKP